MKINELDKNLNNSDKVNKKMRRVKDNEYELFGVQKTPKGYLRLTNDILGCLSKELNDLARNTAGGRIVFRTNASQIEIDVKMPKFIFPMMAESSASGFDVIVIEKNNRYIKPFLQPYENRETGNYSSTIDLKNNNEKILIISMPLYNSPTEINIYINNDAVVSKYNPYKKILPICFYGSSITQGCCASRPSNTFPNLLSQKYMVDFINLGFSGNCRGEIELANYIGKLDISALIIEYDHNSSLQELKNRHFKFVQTICKLKPNLPILIMTRSDYQHTEEDDLRRKEIASTYKKLKKFYDNISFVDGKTIYKNNSISIATVDGTHPNDIGMVEICKAIEPFIKKMLI